MRGLLERVWAWFAQPASTQCRPCWGSGWMRQGYRCLDCRGAGRIEAW